MQNIDNIFNVKKKPKKLGVFNADPKFLQAQYKNFIENKAEEELEKRPNVSFVRSTEHLNSELKLSEDCLTINGCGGYRTARVNQHMEEGCYYWEFDILKSESENSHVRIGCSLMYADLEAPIGFDNFSYGYKDIDGDIIHNKIKKKYGVKYGEGDTVGVLINLPKFSPSNINPSTQIQAKLPPSYGEENHTIPLSIYNNSYIKFFVNGVDQGIAFTDLYYGSYYPAVSLYMNGSVRLNPGPFFKFPPKINNSNNIEEYYSLNDIYDLNIKELLTPLSDI